MSDTPHLRTSYLSPAEALEFLDSRFGIRGRLTPLPGDRDQNFRVDADDGARFVLKIFASDSSPALLDLQRRVLDRLGGRVDGVRTPRPVGDVQRVSTPGGDLHAVWVLTWVDGTPLVGARPRSPEILRSLGRASAGIHLGLAGMPHDAAHREDWLWDLTRADAVLGARATAIHGARGRLVEGIRRTFAEEVRPKLEGLPSGLLHGDLNDHNVLVGPPSGAERRVTGVVDWGDLVHGPRVVDLAIAAAYAALGAPDPLTAAGEVVAGYALHRPLEEGEADLLFDLVRARLAVSVAISASRSPEEREDGYVSVSEAGAWAVLEALGEIHPRLGRAVLREAAGRPAVPAAAPVRRWLREKRHRLKPVLDVPLDREHARIVDLSPASLEVGGIDEVLDVPRFTRTLFRMLEDAGCTVGIGRYAEPRLWYASEAFAADGGEFPERRTVHLGVDLFVPEGTAVHAPLEGTVHSLRDNDDRLDYGPTIVLRHSPEDGPEFWTLWGHLTPDSLEGLSPGDALAAGDVVGRVGGPPENGDWPPHLHLQLVTDLLGWEGNFPGVCRPSRERVWRDLSPDPALLLELPPGSTWTEDEPADAIREARSRLLPSNLSVSYGSGGLHIVRGWRQHLYTPDGQPWLDCVNNVAHVGHGNPRVVEAASRQMATLNTNTRYLHRNLVAYAERLAATFPDPLRVCFFTNSGSEANELALRLARTATGRRDVVVLEAAYHGHTGAVLACSPYKFDGPGGGGREDWVQVAEMPDAYRGRLRDGRDPEPGKGFADSVGAALARSPGGAAAFLHESLLSCAGQIEAPEGYLARAYRHARAAGALCIADEVQVGFGRVGSHFWGFETQGVVPDIVTLGKPMGNGHPLGAVVTTPEVAEAFANGMEYFNTFGGNPVSCAVGLAVLDEIRDGALQSHAHQVGTDLLGVLREIRARHPVLGDVRGRGLFLGMEFATPDDRSPLPEVAAYVVRRMKDHGILLSTDGPDHDVVKFKPPMLFTADDGDRVAAVLDHVLAEDFPRSALETP